MRLPARLTASYALGALAVSAPWPALLALVWDRTGSDTALALVGGARVAPYVLLSWWAGALGDRLPRDRIVRVSAWTRLVLLTLVAMALTCGWLEAAVVLATLAVAVATPAYPALAAGMPDLAPDDTPGATRWLVTAEVGAWVAGPAIGGLALAGGGLPAVALATVALAVAGCLLMAGTPTGWGRVGDTISYAGAVATLLRTPVALRGIAVIAVVELVDGAMAVGLLRVVTDHWGGAEREFGLTIAAIGVGALLAPIVCGAVRLPATAQARPLLLLAAAFVLVTLAPDWQAALVPLALTGVLSTQVECAVTARIQAVVPRSATACVLGITDTVIVAAGLVGVLAAPYAVTLLGSVGFLLALTIIGLVAVPLVPRRQPAIEVLKAA